MSTPTEPTAEHHTSPAPTKHETRHYTVRATCTCGWTGPPRYMQDTALKDGTRHEREHARNPYQSDGGRWDGPWAGDAR